MVFDELRNLGDFNHNITVLQGGKGELIVKKRISSSSDRTADEYLPCTYCLAFCISSELWRHVKGCKFRTRPLAVVPENQKGTIKLSRWMLRGAVAVGLPEIVNREFAYHIIESMMPHEVSNTAKRDHLILLHGKVMFDKLGMARANEVRSRCAMVYGGVVSRDGFLIRVYRCAWLQSA